MLACVQFSILFADQVILKNGDRISGAVLRFDGKNVVMKSEFAGEVTIPWTAVTAITSTTPLSVGLKDGQVIVGTVQGSESKFEVATKDTGTVSAPRDTVVSIRSKEEQAAYDAQIERYRNPRLIDLWTGALDLGYAQSEGNAEAETFNLTANAARSTSRQDVGLFRFHFLERPGPGNRRKVHHGQRQTRRDRLQPEPQQEGVCLWVGGSRKRSVPVAGPALRPGGRRRIPRYQERHDGARSTSRCHAQSRILQHRPGSTTGEALLGEVFMHKFNKITTFQIVLTSPGSINRMNFDASLATSIRKWLSWQLAISDRYLSAPAPGHKDNDLLFTTGARLTFAK